MVVLPPKGWVGPKEWRESVSVEGSPPTDLPNASPMTFTGELIVSHTAATGATLAEVVGSKEATITTASEVAQASGQLQ